MLIYTGYRNSEDEEGKALSLVEPAFAQVSSNATFLKDEAGISLYLDAHRTIDLSSARTQIDNIEKETSDYVIGSIHLPGLSEDEDVHCFVHIVGWIVIYYLKSAPTSKIIDWNQWSATQKTLTTNKLQVGLLKIANAVGVVTTGAKYYHFQYPNATKLMLIIETQKSSAGDSFNLTIPNELTVYERSWSHFARYLYYESSQFKVDTETIDTLSVSGRAYNQTECGQLQLSQLSQGLIHEVSISGAWNSGEYYVYGVGIALVYEEL
jgi:hypothetical protein